MTSGKSSIYISHRLASTRFCDRIIMIADGGIGEEGTHEELLKAGLKVPDDVLLAGVDGDHVSAQCDPPLTTFVQPCEEIGSAAVELMLSRVENPSLPPREMMIASQFVARASTAPFAKKGR